MKNNIINNKIIGYNELMYNNTVVNTTDFINDKYNNIHKDLYNNALTSYISAYISNANLNITVDNYKTTHKFIEIKKQEYWMPSSVIEISNEFPYNRRKIDLTKYWNKYQYNIVSKDISYLYIDDDSTKDAEIIYIDYVKGKAKFKSKFTGKEFWATTDYINENTKYSNEHTLANTFTYMLNNNIVYK